MPCTNLLLIVWGHRPCKQDKSNRKKSKFFSSITLSLTSARWIITPVRVPFFLQPHLCNKFFLLQKHKPQWVICYDSIPLLSFRIVSKFILFKRPRVWYHNHDIIDGYHKFSVSWWAMKSEKSYFKSIDIFSLPSHERQQYFRMD